MGFTASISGADVPELSHDAIAVLIAVTLIIVGMVGYYVKNMDKNAQTRAEETARQLAETTRENAAALAAVTKDNAAASTAAQEKLSRDMTNAVNSVADGVKELTDRCGQRADPR